MPATRPGQELGDRGRVGGVVEDQQPPRPLPQRIARPGGQLGRGQLRRQPEHHPEVGQGGHHAQLGLGRHPPAKLVVGPVALGVGQGQLGLADPTHAVQRRGRHQRRRALAGQLRVERGQLLIAAGEGAHRRRDRPRPPGRDRWQPAAS